MTMRASRRGVVSGRSSTIVDDASPALGSLTQSGGSFGLTDSSGSAGTTHLQLGNGTNWGKFSIVLPGPGWIDVIPSGFSFYQGYSGSANVSIWGADNSAMTGAVNFCPSYVLGGTSPKTPYLPPGTWWIYINNFSSSIPYPYRAVRPSIRYLT